MTNLKNYCETAKADSFKLSVPTNKIPKKVKISEVVNDTAEIIKDKEILESFTKEINGVSFTTGFEFVPSKQAYNRFYHVNSKQAETDYFSGITNKNIHFVYDNIMSNIPEMYHISKNEFLKSNVSDLDICRDVIIGTISECEPYLKHLHECFSLKYDSNNIKLEKDNGLINAFRIVTRKTANNEIPYFKTYHKGFELQTKSHVFLNNYLKNYSYSDIDKTLRSEITYKYGKNISNILKDNKLETVLNSDVNRLFNFRMSKHFGNRFNFNLNDVISNKSFNAYEQSMLNLLLSLKIDISKNDFLDMTILKAPFFYECRKAKNRQIKRNNDLFNIYETLKNNSLLF
jgi:hypothetical protein